jgi:hypothetical protein
VEIDVPDGMIRHLTSDCGGNVNHGHVVEVTSGSLEKELDEPIQTQRRKERFRERENVKGASVMPVEGVCVTRGGLMVRMPKSILFAPQSGMAQEVEWPQKNRSLILTGCKFW